MCDFVCNEEPRRDSHIVWLRFRGNYEMQTFRSLAQKHGGSTVMHATSNCAHGLAIKEKHGINQ